MIVVNPQKLSEQLSLKSQLNIIYASNQMNLRSQKLLSLNLSKQTNSSLWIKFHIMLRLLILQILLVATLSGYSRFSGHCPLNFLNLQLSLQPNERPIKAKHVKRSFTPTPKTSITYEDFRLIRHSFIGAGASAQVFLVEDLNTGQMYIAKRYFKQNVFREENFIMRRMGYEVRWAKDPKYNNTISLFPYKETKNLKEVVLEREKFKLAMYKTILELDKTHKQGFIHMDVKPINIVVDSYKQSKTYTSKKCDITLIDWNLAVPYYESAEYLSRHGTRCYMAPELLLNLKYYTAAVDVWSLGISLYYVYTGVKPNNASCSRDALAGMLIFVGYDRMIELYEKYRPRADLRTLGMMGKYRDEPGVLENVLGEELEVGVARLLRRMLVVDPEERASMEELLSDEYFREVFEFSPPYEEKNRMKKLKKMMKMEQVSANTEDED